MKVLQMNNFSESQMHIKLSLILIFIIHVFDWFFGCSKNYNKLELEKNIILQYNCVYIYIRKIILNIVLYITNTFKYTNITKYSI